MDKQLERSPSFFSCFKAHFSEDASINGSELTEDEQAKRRYGLVVMLLGVASELGFALVNFFDSKIETALDLSSVMLFVFALILLCKKSKQLAAYRVCVGTVMFLCTYSIFFTHHDLPSIILGYFLLPLLVFYLLGFKEGLLWIVPFWLPVLLLSFVPELFGRDPLPKIFVLDLVISLALLTIFGGFVEYCRENAWRVLIKVSDDLKAAAQQLETLEGFIPICSFCKKVRDDSGYWNKLEHFLAENTSAQIGKGLCRSCKRAQSLEGPSIVPIMPPPERPIMDTVREENDKIKRRFVVLIGLLGVVIICFFSANDFLLGYSFKAGFQLSIAFLFLTNMGLLALKKRTAWVYQSTIGGLVVLIVQFFFTGHSDVSDILWFFIIPIVACHLLGWKKALYLSVGLYAFVLLVLIQVPFINGVSYSVDFSVYFCMLFFLVIVLSISMERIREHYSLKIANKIIKLNETNENIKTLKGLVPVCSACKSIRDDKGFWTDLETYLTENTELELSHGICPKCLKQQHPEIYLEMLAAGELDERPSLMAPKF